MTTDKTVTSLTPDAITRAVQMAGVEEAPIPLPRGQIGGCVACGHTAASHFANGRWVGCINGSDDTVFILIPVHHDDRRQGGAPSSGLGLDLGLRTKRQRFARRAIYRSKIHHLAKLDKLRLSDARMRVLQAIHESGKGGIQARDIGARTKLPHGTVQQTLRWLRDQGHVEAAPLSSADASSESSEE